MVVVDHNDMQADGRTAEIMGVEPIDARFAAFGWWVRRVDGHDVDALLRSFRSAIEVEGRPAMLVCDTVPGKGSPTLEEFRRVHFVRADAATWQAALTELS